MGLDTSHNAWHGPYSSFMRWREWVAEQIGIPLKLMEGFYFKEEHDPFGFLEHYFRNGDEMEMSYLRRFKKMLPLRWESFKPSPLHKLLYHSDCDGYINWTDCGKIANALEELLKNIETDNKDSEAKDIKRANYDGNYEATKRFIEGCKLAYSQKEKLDFH